MKTWISVVWRVTLILSLVGVDVCVLKGGTTASTTTTTTTPPSTLSQAADEFKVLTRDLGIRPESPPNAQDHRGRKMLWHGRVYENFRNDILDAIPHEVRQNGKAHRPCAAISSDSILPALCSSRIS